MLWAGPRLAVTLLTAIPLPGRRNPADPPARRVAAAAMYAAPAVALLAAALAIGTGAVATRALHLDGLADFADGLGSAKPAGQALDIMRRSDIGPFGVVTLILTLLIQVSALARAQERG